MQTTQLTSVTSDDSDGNLSVLACMLAIHPWARTKTLRGGALEVILYGPRVPTKLSAVLLVCGLAFCVFFGFNTGSTGLVPALLVVALTLLVVYISFQRQECERVVLFPNDKRAELAIQVLELWPNDSSRRQHLMLVLGLQPDARKQEK